MACGVPTLVSTDGAMSEVVGEAAVRVDPSSVEEIASGLERLLTDEVLRERMAAEGPVQVAPFTWKPLHRLSWASTARWASNERSGDKRLVQQAP